MNARKAVQLIEKDGILLVYPIDNRKEPPSLWSRFFPRSPMLWEWDDEGDTRVSDLWHLRMELSRSGKVIYAKWFRGRATFFSREIFTALLALSGAARGGEMGLRREAAQILELLEHDSPQSTKQIKAETELRGRALEPLYERAMKQLWSRFLVVGYGEVDDGAFPSLAIGATKLIFEELWNASLEMSRDEAWEIARRKLPAESLFLKQLGRELGSESNFSTSRL